MSRYIRTKNGIIDLNRTHLDGSPIYNLDTKENVIKANENGEERDCYYIENDTFYHYWYGDGCIWEDHIINQADTIEELIQDGDILYIHDLYPDVVLVVEGNIKPFGYNNSIKLKEWLKLEFTEFDLYIKQSNGDYHKIAEKKQYRKLALI